MPKGSNLAPEVSQDDSDGKPPQRGSSEIRRKHGGSDNLDATGGGGRSLPQEPSTARAQLRTSQPSITPPPRRPAQRVRVAGRPSRIAQAAFLQELELTSPAAAPSARSRATPRAARRRSGAEGGGGVPVAARSASSRTSAGMGAGRGHRTRLDGTGSLGRAPHAGRGSRTPRQRGVRGPGIGTTDD